MHSATVLKTTHLLSMASERANIPMDGNSGSCKHPIDIDHIGNYTQYLLPLILTMLNSNHKKTD